MIFASYFDDVSLEPAETALATSVWEDVLRAFKVTDRGDPIAERSARHIVEIVRSGERDSARIRLLAFDALANSHPPATGTPDLDQSARTGANDHSGMEWKPIASAPFDCDLELAVIDYDGPHALVFPCRRILDGWVDADTRLRLDIHPTHWREWQDA